MDKTQIIGLLAAADALPETIAGPALGWEDDKDSYGRAVDVLDSLALIQRWHVNSIGEPFEVLTLEGLVIHGPRGFTPLADRQEKTPTSRLAERELDTEGVMLLGRIARTLTSGEQSGTLNYAQRVKAGITLSRLLREMRLAPLSEPLTDDEAGQDTKVVPLDARRRSLVTQRDGEGA